MRYAPQVHRSQLTLVVVSLAVGACALPHDTAVSSRSHASSELTGFLYYEGEFQIYPTQEAMRDRLKGTRQCISGVFSNLQRHVQLSRRLHGKKVLMIGGYVDWAPILEKRTTGDPITATGELLQNACHGTRVFIAEDAQAVD